MTNYEIYTLYINHTVAETTVYGKANAKNLAINASRLYGVVDVANYETGEIVFSYENGFKR